MSKEKLKNWNLRFIWILGFVVWGFGCKPPLPVYFDNPIGTKIQGFDTLIAGNYVPLDDVVEKGTKEFSDKYTIKYDKIIPKDSSFSVEVNGKEINYDEVKEILGVKKDTGKAEIKEKDCDSIFHSLCAFNELVSVRLGSALGKKPSRPKAGMIKIAYDRVYFISVDSAARNQKDTLLTLDAKILLTKYSGKYFLNFKTPFGWEILQMDLWEEKFLSVRPFYFTGYDNCAATVASFTSSTKDIYPNLSPIINPQKKIIGFRAAMNPKTVLDKFKGTEEVILLLKIK